MTTKEKLHQKELRQPDPLQVRLARLLDAIITNSKYILGALLGGAVLVGGFYLFEGIQNNIRKGRVEELGKIHVVYMGEEKKAADQRDELQKQIDALTPPPAPTDSKGPEGALPEDKPPVTLTPEKEAEKKQLTQKRDDLKADHSVSQKQFESYYKNNSDKPEGWAAGLIVSKILIDQEKRDEARVLFEEIVAKAKGEPFYQIQGRFGLIGLYEEQGDFDKGLGEVDHLMGLLGAGKETSTTKQALYTGYVDELMPRLLLKKAQLQIFKGSKAEAAQTLAQLTEKHSNSPQAQEARQLKAVVQ